MEYKLNAIPLNGRVLVLPDQVKEKVLNSGIIIPDMTQEEPQEGMVLAMADDFTENAPTLKVLKPGMTIIYGKYSGIEVEVEVNGKKQTGKILSAHDILGLRLK